MLVKAFVALSGLLCADVPLRNYSDLDAVKKVFTHPVALL